MSAVAAPESIRCQHGVRRLSGSTGAPGPELFDVDRLLEIAREAGGHQPGSVALEGQRRTQARPATRHRSQAREHSSATTHGWPWRASSTPRVSVPTFVRRVACSPSPISSHQRFAHLRGLSGCLASMIAVSGADSRGANIPSRGVLHGVEDSLTAIAALREEPAAREPTRRFRESRGPRRSASSGGRR